MNDILISECFLQIKLQCEPNVLMELSPTLPTASKVGVHPWTVSRFGSRRYLWRRFLLNFPGCFYLLHISDDDTYRIRRTRALELYNSFSPEQGAESDKSLVEVTSIDIQVYQGIFTEPSMAGNDIVVFIPGSLRNRHWRCRDLLSQNRNTTWALQFHSTL